MNWDQKYQEIAKELGLDMNADLEAAKILNELIISHNIHTNISNLERIINNKKVLVFGAGPSLREDIQEIKNQNLYKDKDYVFIVADGAGKALLGDDILPDIHVTDLDSDPDVILEINRKGSLTVVHAHGDNTQLLREIVPELENFIGTTQTKPFGNLHNFGGFTDGDRCVFLAENFNAEFIVLAGMDFGREIGEYSGKYKKEFKLRKLKIGKKMLEELAKESRVVMLNMTARGEDIENIPRVSVQQLRVF